MVFPRFLLNSDLSETTKILYMILLDRTRLSIKNSGWSNNLGYVYIHFTISELADTLSKGEMTIKNSLSALEKADLIYRQRQGIGLPNKVYVKFPDEAFSPIDRKPSLRQKKTIRLMDRKLSLPQTIMCPLIKIKEVITIQQINLITNEIMKVRNTKVYDKYLGNVLGRNDTRRHKRRLGIDHSQ